MNPTLRLLAAAALAAGVVLGTFAPYASAGRPGGPGSVQPRNAGQNSATAEGRRQLKEMQAEVAQIRAAMNKLRQSVETKLSAQPDWKGVSDGVKKAKDALEAARRPALEAVRKQPDYVAAKGKKEQAQAKLEKLQADRQADPEEITKVATDVSTHAITVTKMEAEAVESDEKVIDAKVRLAEAEEKAEALKEEVELELGTHPDWPQMEQQLEQAEARMEQHKESLEQMARSEAQSKAAARKAEAQSRQGQKSGGGRRSKSGGGF